MVKLLTRAGKQTSRYLVLTTLTATLVACGGGSGDTVPLDEQDFDGDGELNGVDDDADGDGTIDTLDPFVDLDSDGFDDVIGEQDLDGDMIPNKDDPDADNDGLNDFDVDENGDRVDAFIDLNEDGLDDATGEAEAPTEQFTPVSASTPCGSEGGTDNDSSNPSWDDNCLIRRSNGTGEGQFADSLYSAGIQRIVYCSGFGSGASYTDFADGEYGPGSEAAMKLFQAGSPDPLTDDGVVGPATWGKLQGAIERLDFGTFESNGNGSSTAQDSWGFSEGRCAGIALFYQEMTLVESDQSTTEGGWRLAKNTPNTAQSVPFSIDSPFGGVLD